ncbi:helix-turn-helix domain-containing protein [Lapillicoccus jejuensis]|uniref:Helix-turn-helix protein n=1 Tax=Lapillicoccus jejuensis TaxID=402171 RepID=A0A542E2F9_9MICO|nr:helix-turn-helix domain-containing protein [Lapillicoccus jejuensis]TQJ09469.1 helix-turn-helix protein [Lapillicoccus jejuensis]
MSAAAGTFVEELGRAVREVRWRMRVSQRELAAQLGVSKSWVGRVESGEVSAALAVVGRVAADLGLTVVLIPGPAAGTDLEDPRRDGASGDHGRPDDVGARGEVADDPLVPTDSDHIGDGEDIGDGGARGAGAPWRDGATPGPPQGTGRGRVGSPSFDADPRAAALVERWRERAEREGVRDAAGRRMPAHLVAYPMSYPHHWWVVRHPHRSLRRRPIWSFTFRTPTAAAVLLVGDNPPPLGLHPDGGWPMQGRPSAEVRAQWPPTFPVRPRWYPPPLSGN